MHNIKLFIATLVCTIIFGALNANPAEAKQNHNKALNEMAMRMYAQQLAGQQQSYNPNPYAGVYNPYTANYAQPYTQQYVSPYGTYPSLYQQSYYAQPSLYNTPYNTPYNNPYYNPYNDYNQYGYNNSGSSLLGGLLNRLF